MSCFEYWEIQGNLNTRLFFIIKFNNYNVIMSVQRDYKFQFSAFLDLFEIIHDKNWEGNF